MRNFKTSKGNNRGLFFQSSIFTVLVAFALAFSVFSLTANAQTALINGDTVSGGTTSAEAMALTAQGYTVTVVTNAQWQAMTQAQFGSFQLLVIGDATCSPTSALALANVATWAPVVLGTAGGRTQAGNRILIGTDPVFHISGFGGVRRSSYSAHKTLYTPHFIF